MLLDCFLWGFFDAGLGLICSIFVVLFVALGPLGWWGLPLLWVRFAFDLLVLTIIYDY